MTCVLWNLALVCLEIVLVSVQDMSKVCLRNYFGSTCWYFGEEAQVEARFDLFGDSANLDARKVHDLHGTYHMFRNQFGRTQRNS